MTRRSPEEYNWDQLEFDETILPIELSRYTSPRQLPIQFVVIHHMTVAGVGNGSALDACWNIWQTREASAQYGVDGTLVRQFVWDNDAAWATANWEGNNAGISIEHANSAVGDVSGWPVADVTWHTGARLAAQIHVYHELGRPWSNGNGSDGTLRVHQSFWNTGCPGPFIMSIWDDYVAAVQGYYDAIVNGTTVDTPATPAPAEAPAEQKSIGQLADEVIAGLYGTGDNRRAVLGDLYDEVQAEVNRKLGAAPAPVQALDINALADAVIRGEYGSGDERRQRLGVNYDAVQAAVNAKLSGQQAYQAGPSVTDVAWQVINGEWGNGDDRIARLSNAGYDFGTIQAEVNRLLG